MLQVNAHVTAIHGAGTADDWDRAGGPGAEKWAGRAPAYYQEKIDRVRGAGDAVDVLTRRTLYVDTAEADAMALDTDDVITLELDRGPAVQAKALLIARAALDGFDAVATTRIELEAA